MERENESEWVIERKQRTGPGNWEAMPGERPRTLAACRTQLAQMAGARSVMPFIFVPLLAMTMIFAFAVWDAPSQRLLLARDHLGVKPLYYAEQDGNVLFASESGVE